MEGLKSDEKCLTDESKLLLLIHISAPLGIAKTGGHRYADGTRYIGDWSQKGQKHGMGHLLLPDGTRYGKEINHFSSTLLCKS
jgi:hypothetical protein